MRPLHVLVFLLPLLAAYEIGSVLYLSDMKSGVMQSVRAYRLFDDFFQVFGLAGAALPGIALVTVLVVWHVLARDRWRIDGETLAGMFIESFAWTLPLLVLAATVAHAGASTKLGFAAGDAGRQSVSIAQLQLMARATISVGAGLYEEMLFRLVALAVLHFVLVDIIGLTHRWGYAIGILISALGFAFYHTPTLPAEWAYFVFTLIAGVYFGTVYVMRGFGVVVMTHAIYDVLVLVVFPGLGR